MSLSKIIRHCAHIARALVSCGMCVILNSRAVATRVKAVRLSYIFRAIASTARRLSIWPDKAWTDSFTVIFATGLPSPKGLNRFELEAS